MYKNYIFDLYGTLVDINTDENKRYLWDKTVHIYKYYGAEYKINEFKEKYKEFCKEEEAKLNTVDYPEIQLEKVFIRLFKEKGVDISEDIAICIGKSFRAISTKYIRLYDGVIDFLENLKKKNKKVYLLSNAQSMFTRSEMDMLHITKYFDGIVISSDEGCKKPDKKFYEVVLNRYNLNKEESIMIGNDPITDIKGSYEVGIDSLYIHSNISPKNVKESELLSKYIVMDGNFRKIEKLILK